MRIAVPVSGVQVPVELDELRDLGLRLETSSHVGAKTAVEKIGAVVASAEHEAPIRPPDWTAQELDAIVHSLDGWAMELGSAVVGDDLMALRNAAASALDAL